MVLGMLATTLAFSLLRSMLSGKRVIRADEERIRVGEETIIAG